MHSATDGAARHLTPRQRALGSDYLVTPVTTSWLTWKRYSSRVCPGTILANGRSITVAPSLRSPSPRSMIRSFVHVGR
jgi:hypothetical protein